MLCLPDGHRLQGFGWALTGHWGKLRADPLQGAVTLDNTRVQR